MDSGEVLHGKLTTGIYSWIIGNLSLLIMILLSESVESGHSANHQSAVVNKEQKKSLFSPLSEISFAFWYGIVIFNILLISKQQVLFLITHSATSK